MMLQLEVTAALRVMEPAQIAGALIEGCDTDTLIVVREWLGEYLGNGDKPDNEPGPARHNWVCAPCGCSYPDVTAAEIEAHMAAHHAPKFCEHVPYPGAGYHCLREHGHYPGTVHSDLTIGWDDNGYCVNEDGQPI